MFLYNTKGWKKQLLLGISGKEIIYLMSTADANQANSLTYTNLITHILSK